jgi:hypothetical protein
MQDIEATIKISRFRPVGEMVLTKIA